MLGAGNGFNRLALGQQNAVGDAAALADGSGLYGTRLVALGQHDGLGCMLGLAHQLIAERRW